MIVWSSTRTRHLFVREIRLHPERDRFAMLEILIQLPFQLFTYFLNPLPMSQSDPADHDGATVRVCNRNRS